MVVVVVSYQPLWIVAAYKLNLTGAMLGLTGFQSSNHLLHSYAHGASPRWRHQQQ